MVGTVKAQNYENNPTVDCNKYCTVNRVILPAVLYLSAC